MYGTVSELAWRDWGETWKVARYSATWFISSRTLREYKICSTVDTNLAVILRAPWNAPNFLTRWPTVILCFVDAFNLRSNSMTVPPFHHKQQLILEMRLRAACERQTRWRLLNADVIVCLRRLKVQKCQHELYRPRWHCFQVQFTATLPCSFASAIVIISELKLISSLVSSPARIYAFRCGFSYLCPS